jgi:hypothetical protein
VEIHLITSTPIYTTGCPLEIEKVDPIFSQPIDLLEIAFLAHRRFSESALRKSQTKVLSLLQSSETPDILFKRLAHMNVRIELRSSAVGSRQSRAAETGNH